MKMRVVVRSVCKAQINISSNPVKVIYVSENLLMKSNSKALNDFVTKYEN